MAELARYALPRALRWERPPAAAEPRHPAADELEILMALGALGVLSSSQIHRRYLGGLSPRGLRHRLQSMAAQGWLRRGHLLCAGPGQTPRICSLTDSGRGLVEARLGADPFEVVWDDLDQVVHALHVAAWWLAFERVAGRQVDCVRRRTGAPWTRPDLELHMAPRFAIAHVLVAVRPPLPSRTALQQRLDLLLTWGGDVSSTAELLVLPDEPTAITMTRAMASLADSARVDGTKPAWLGRRVHLTSELDIHHSRLRALTLRSPLPSARTEVALVDLLGRR
jgi:DNA-binding HxlR family transcriptional regulator